MVRLFYGVCALFVVVVALWFYGLSRAAAQDTGLPKDVSTEPCSARPCTVARLGLAAGGTARFTVRRAFGVWHRTQEFRGFVGGRRANVLAFVEPVRCGAYFYGGGLTVLARMPRCEQRSRSPIVVRVTNGRPGPVRLVLRLIDYRADR